MAGKTWDFVDQDVLGSDDFSDVRQDLSPLADLWRSLATALGLPTSSVSEVELECRGVPARCLDLIIEKWLNQDYPYSKFGLPSWRRLVLAVDSRAGGKYPKLARDIAEKHPAHKHKVCSSLLQQAQKGTLDSKLVTVPSTVQTHESVIKDATADKPATVLLSTPKHELCGTGTILATISSTALVNELVVEGSVLSTCKSVTPLTPIQDTKVIDDRKSGNMPGAVLSIAQNHEPTVEGSMADKPSTLQVPSPIQQHEGSSVDTVDDKPATVMPTSQIHESFGEGAEVNKQVIGNDIHQSLSQKRALFMYEPIGDKPVTALDGIGDKLCERLVRKGFDKAYTVLGQFLLLKKDRELFMEWLSGTFDAELQEQLNCYDCLKEWCDIYI